MSTSNPVELHKLNEKSQFMDEQKTKENESQVTCCRNKHTKNCCIASGVFGGIFLVLGKIFSLSIIFVGNFSDQKIKYLYISMYLISFSFHPTYVLCVDEKLLMYS